MKILLLDNPGCLLDFGLRCVDAGHEVRWFIGPTKEGLRNRVGDGIKSIKKVAQWEAHMDWADLVVLSDNVKYIDGLERFHRAGYPIVGPNRNTTDWELDRDIGQRVFEQCGIECIESHEFNNYDHAKEFVMKTNKRYVSKPSGDADKALSYVSKNAADMVFMLEYWKKNQKRKAPFILQEFVPGIEMAVGGWFGPGGWSQYVLENFEHKKLMNDDKGPNTGEMGCYSSDTEVLTDSGWKYWPDVTYDDKLATLIGDEVVFETPSAIVEYQVDTEMVAWKNQTIDLLVTPNHNMYVQRQHAARQGRDEYEFLAAEDCTQSQYEVKRTASWGAEHKPFFIIPEYIHNKGKGVCVKPEVLVDSIAFARFMGLYIAEGSSTKGAVNISQSHPEKAKKAEHIVASIGFKYSCIDNGFNIYNSQLAAYTKPFGRAWEKRVPDFVKNGSQEVIKAFLEGYALGDGHTYEKGYRTFYSCNDKLLGDVQELLLKVGSLGVITQRPERNGSYINGRLIKAKRPQYELCERPNKTRSWLDARDRFTVPYKGTVHCATVSSHVLFVRRNGKPIWCGNTVMKYCTWEDSKLAQEMLEPLTGHLYRSNYVGYMDVAVIIDDKGQPWPLEFTSRPGWPLFQIQQALHPDPCEWMHDMVNGFDSFNPSMDVAAGVLIALPDFPYSQKKKEELFGYPIYGITEQNRPQLHPGEMAMDIAPNDVNGRVKMENMLVSAGDWLITVSGTGKTVSKAVDRAYKVVGELSIPNSPIYRTDIGKRLEKQLPKLQKLGYATSWVYE